MIQIGKDLEGDDVMIQIGKDLRLRYLTFPKLSNPFFGNDAGFSNFFSGNTCQRTYIFFLFFILSHFVI